MEAGWCDNVCDVGSVEVNASPAINVGLNGGAVSEGDNVAIGAVSVDGLLCRGLVFCTVLALLVQGFSKGDWRQAFPRGSERGKFSDVRACCEELSPFLGVGVPPVSSFGAMSDVVVGASGSSWVVCWQAFRFFVGNETELSETGFHARQVTLNKQNVVRGGLQKSRNGTC